MIQVQCPQCLTTYKMGDHLAGRKVQCKSCPHKFRVPSTETTQPATEAPAPITLASSPTAITTRCPRCLADYNLKPKYAGQSVRCRDCKTTFTVPDPFSATSESSVNDDDSLVDVTPSAFPNHSVQPPIAQPEINQKAGSYSSLNQHQRARNSDQFDDLEDVPLSLSPSPSKTRPTTSGQESPPGIHYDEEDAEDLQEALPNPRRVQPASFSPAPCKPRTRGSNSQGFWAKVTGVVTAIVITMFTITLQRAKRAAIRNAGQMVISQTAGSEASPSDDSVAPTTPVKRHKGELHPEFQRITSRTIGSPVPDAHMLAADFRNRDISVHVKYNQAKIDFLNQIAIELAGINTPLGQDFHKRLEKVIVLKMRVDGSSAVGITIPYGPYPKEEREIAKAVHQDVSKAVDAVFDQLKRLNAEEYRNNNIVGTLQKLEQACVDYETKMRYEPEIAPVEDYVEVDVAGLTTVDEGNYIRDELHRLTRPIYAREWIQYQQVERYTMWPVKDAASIARQIKFGEIVKIDGNVIWVEAYPIDPAKIQAWKDNQKANAQTKVAAKPAPKPKREPIFLNYTDAEIAALPYISKSQLGSNHNPFFPNMPAGSGNRAFETTTLPQGGSTIFPNGPPPGAKVKSYQYYSSTEVFTSGTSADDPEIPKDADNLTRGLAMIRSRNPIRQREGFDLLLVADIKGRDSVVIEAMKEILNQPVYRFSREIIQVLARCKSPEVITILNKQLANPISKTEVIQVLADAKDPSSIQPLVKAMYHDLRKQIDPVLVSYGPKAEDALIQEISSDARFDVIQRCCTILQSVGTEKSIAPLKKLAQTTQSPMVKTSVEAALKAIDARKK